MSARICICAVQVPFTTGGAEILVDTLGAELRRRSFEVEVVRLPFAWSSRLKILKSALAWRMLDLEREAGGGIDLVIATRFPSYAIKHRNKVVWLVHQFRQVYDLLGTRFSDFEPRDGRDRKVIEMIGDIDRRTLSEARARFTIAGNTTERLKRFNGLDSTPLYPPPKHADAYRAGDPGNYILGIGRLDAIKRFDLLVKAMKHTGSGARCLIAGSGPEQERLAGMIAEARLSERVRLLGWVDDERLLELYAGCRAVFYAPFDEDYGYVTVEAFKSSKPVLTSADSGAVLEFVEDGVNGYVCPPDSPRALARSIDKLFSGDDLAVALGRRGRETVARIGWDTVIESLTATL